MMIVLTVFWLGDPPDSLLAYLSGPGYPLQVLFVILPHAGFPLLSLARVCHEQISKSLLRKKLGPRTDDQYDQKGVPDDFKNIVHKVSITNLTL